MDARGLVHRRIEDYAALLHSYVNAAHAASEELPEITDVEDDPRIERLRWELGLLGAQLDEAFLEYARVGAPVAVSYEGEDEAATAGDEILEGANLLSLEFEVEAGECELWPVLGLLESAGERIVEDISGVGCNVTSWSVTQAATD